MLELKRLTEDGVPNALAKAERYRLLNQPWEAECIYLDVLDTEPDNQDALMGLLLALTDQFGDGPPGGERQARDVVARMRGEYERAYYTGIIHERRAKVMLQRARPGAGTAAYDLLQQAMTCYAEAETHRPSGNDDALLRWNACVRLLQRNPHAVAASSERFEAYAD